MAAMWRTRCAFTCFFNGKCPRILNNSTVFDRKLTLEQLSVLPDSKTYSSYRNSPFVENITKQYNYEIIKNPPEWTYVERLLPFETIPQITPKDNYASGWIPPKEEAKDLPYFLTRTKNQELPVYLNISLRGHRKITKIKKIEGDIWLLNDEIKDYLKTTYNKYVETRVHELGKFIEVKGDYVNSIREWAHSKGF